MEELLLSYARDLDDAYPAHEFSIWSREALLGYFNEALCIIASYRPDMFAELKVVKVDVCSTFLDLCDCVKVLDVLGQCDSEGNLIHTLSKRAGKGAVWTGSSRKHVFTDELKEYEIVDSNLVRVYPVNLVRDKDLYVLVRCSVEPPEYKLDSEAPDARCAFMAGARQWVLYNAKMVDGEFSGDMQAQAREHKDLFLRVLDIVDKGDARNDSKKKG